MEVLLTGTETTHLINAVARGFNQLPNCRASVYTYPHAPAAGMRQGSRLGRFWRGLNTRSINRAVVESVKTRPCDLAVCLEAGSMMSSTVADIRRNVPIVLWPLEAPSGHELEAETLQNFSRVFCRDPAEQDSHPNASYLPTGFDDSTFQRQEGREIAHDLLWIGEVREELLPRLDQIAALAAEKGHSFGVYGAFRAAGKSKEMLRADFPALAQAIRRDGAVAPRTASRLFSGARIVVDLHAGAPADNPITAHLLGAAGVGAMLLAEERQELATLLEPDAEMAFFSGQEQFAERVAFFLGNETERQAVAERGCARVHRDHTFTIRAKEILAAALPPATAKDEEQP